MKIYFKTIGCRVNQVETQSIAEKFASLGHAKTPDFNEADAFFLNTCAVTSKADRDTLNFAGKVSKSKRGAKLIVTGCYADLFPGRILQIYPEALIFKNDEKEAIPFKLENKTAEKDFFSVSGFSDRSRAFVKIQEGCSLKCSYCIVPAARPHVGSKPSKNLLKEIRLILEKGYKEIVICGTRLGMYRCPLTGMTLVEIMAEIFRIPCDFRIRFSSIGAAELSENLVKVLKDGKAKFCDYFHIPLQSGSDKVLGDMNRNYDKRYYLDRIEFVRKNFHEPGLFTDVIVGYPTETEEDFHKTSEFVENCGFAGLHVFRYSIRPGTGAAGCRQLNGAVVKKRAKTLLQLDKTIREKFARSLIGSVQKLVILKNHKTGHIGLTSKFQNVFIPGSYKPGAFVYAVIEGVDGNVCIGRPITAVNSGKAGSENTQ
ncbi:MAG: MiaB/RimO family radical SAM methylthiotransferase [Elusimicrobia bacterium]|nr:MiaB/RimO family radical SAM methylthiotransferase [Elusimicrobiota bacterium]